MNPIVVTVLCIVLGSLIGCATNAPVAAQRESTPAPAASEPQIYRLHPGDLIDIKFYYNDALSDTVRIRPDGRISVQLLGDIGAAGRTPDELRALLLERYASYQRNPDLVVIVREFAAQMVYVGGEVNSPGPVQTFGSLTAMRAVMASGGFKNSAEPETVVVLRQQPGSDPLFMTVDMKERLQGVGGGDVLLQPFDVVFVPKSRIARMDQFVDQYIRQLLPFTMTVGFSWIKDIDDSGVVR